MASNFHIFELCFGFFEAFGFDDLHHLVFTKLACEKKIEFVDIESADRKSVV